MLPGNTQPALAANPAPVQYYYVTLPEDDLLTLFDENQDALGGYAQVISPIRSITSIAIGETGTLVYWDQWEDGGYDSDIANPGANVYNAGSNPDGTQVWGDGDLTNGCPPRLASGPNPCTAAADDQFVAGDVIILDNDVTVLYSTNPDNVLDQFNAVAYNNNNGNKNWATDWDETEDNDNPASGTILITGNQLRFDNADANDIIEREVNLPTGGGATAPSNIQLKFILGYSGVANNDTDTFRLDISSNGGGSWTELANFGDNNLPASGSSQVFNIGAYASANTRIRFYQEDSPESGEYWYVDDVEIEFGGSYYRDTAQIYFDGRDKVGTTSAVAMSRAAFPPTPGSVMAGGSEMFDTSQWGTSFMAPIGEDTAEPNNSSFEDVRWFIMAGTGGATIDVDANGDGDVADAGDLNDFVMTEGGRKALDGINDGATLTVVAGNAVQVNSMTADNDDTFEFRWDALVARPNWTNDYVTPVGTTRTGAAGTNGCTEIWAYNPNAAQITISYDFDGGNTYPTQDGSFTVPANSAAASPAGVANLLTNGNGARFWTAGGQVFSPISITDCTQENSNGRLMDWGAPLVPTSQLTSEVLVGLAPGCSNESHSGICRDPDSTAGGTTPDITGNDASRNVVFVSAIAATTIYVDTNGSGLTCSGGTVTGAEQSQAVAAASILTSYRFDDDPTSRSYVHDDFGSQNYSRDDSVDGWAGNQTWSSDWTEGGGEGGGATGGAILIDTTAPATLRFQADGTNNEAGRTIQRNHNTSGSTFARLSFRLFSSTGLDATDRLAVEVSTNGTTWTTLQTFVGPYVQTLPGPSFPVAEVFNISAYIANPTYIRFRIVDDLETGDYWAVDHVHIDYATGGDFDMSGAFIKAYNSDCSTTPIAVAYGQYPSLTGGNDDEALDLGTLVPPFRPPSIKLGAIGNYVWLDEDGDGDQDAGEAGIPNVKVTLTGTSTDGTVYNLATYTDANGGYLFPDIKPGGNYTITVDQTTLPAGLAANPTYDENGTGTAHTTTVSLAAGAEHMTADFGYNWSSTNETNTNTGTGAIGDRVWSDDGDGVQEPNEVGIYNVTVQLITAGADGLFGTGDDVVAATTTTDHNGNYIFDGLAAGAYVVKIPTAPGTQTGDPDATLDNQTTDPIVLAPGDVFLNADFGYQLSNTGTIGDTLWMDSDRGNDVDAGEARLPGVTVSLIKDLDGDGTWDVGEPIIATDITDESGVYGFFGLPTTNGAGSDDYLVWVNDTDNVLAELTPTYDVRDGGSQGNPTTGVRTGLEISAVTDLTTTAVTNADFAYAPSGHDAGEGLIGDTIFLDLDNDGAFDPGEGMEGISVELLNSSGQLVGVTNTNENGQYFFGGLAAGTYTVRVVTNTLPAGLTNTVDPDGGTANQSSVTIAAGGVNLAQDFGYRDTSSPNTIGGTLWEDVDADGTKDGGETTVYPNVTVNLYTDTNGNGVLDGGDEIVGTTNTDGSGNYSFANLPDGTFFVDVTDNNNILNGLWKSNGTNPGVDNNSQVDPYKVTVSGGQTNTTGDFGYYEIPAALGNFVWEDLDGDGVQDAGEPGISGALVTLTITWPGGAGTTTLKTTTAADGSYSFENLLLDEDFDGAGAGEPAFSISVATPAGFAETQRDQGGNEALDSDNASGQAATATQGAVNNTYDFGFVRLGSIGDAVWLDEDGDGDQDAGEAGIPNVKVTLSGTAYNGAPVSLTTYTDANGNYIFDDVPPGSYTVTVDQTTLAAGLAANPTYDENGTGTPHTSTVTLLPNQEYTTADFGYNWASTNETNNNTGTGAIGDRVWSDADGDGVQDPEEVGLAGVTVQLWYDSDDDGDIDSQYGSNVTTDANGNYIFDGLPAGIYEVRVTGGTSGYNQTGDPDQPGLHCTTCDNKTTTPILLSPGDVYVNADFGYQPDTGTTGTIGDTVWLDANRNNSQDGGEPGIPGVTVALIKDLDGDGAWDAGEPIIATDVTDANGYYQFTGLPTGSSADYLVWVNDTSHVLGELVPTYDVRDGGSQGNPASGLVTGLTISAVSDLTTTAVTNADFAFAPRGHDAGEGIIGDTIFLDRDNSGTPGAGEGLEGVKVQLYDSTGTTLLATTYTDENGNYTFGGLPAATYVVKVDPATLPAGVTNTTDPDGGTANQSTVALPSGGVNLAQDFGYRDTSNPNSISGTIWKDTNADGTKDGGETTGIGGVIVVLRDASGDIVATTTTDSSGNYSFTNLPDGTYTVDVTDNNNVLNGYWKSTGPNPGVDNNSQVEPYSLTVSGGQTNTTADFGYFIEPAKVGNFVWKDIDGDGIQDGGEPGLANVTVILEIEYPNGATITLKTTTDSTGYYEFGNLLLDEDFDGAGTTYGSGGDEPKFTVKVDQATVPVGYAPSPVNAGTGSDDSRDPDGTVVTNLARGAANMVTNMDFGFDPVPTSVTVLDFKAAYLNSTSVKVTWTASNITSINGFNLYRSESLGGPRVLVGFIQVNDDIFDENYEYLDLGATGVTYYYWLAELIAPDNTEHFLGDIDPAVAVYRDKYLFLPFAQR
jgi:protocatechuate 3,4-dioxygenase beta subunit